MAREQKYHAVIQKAVLRKSALDRLSLCLSAAGVLVVVDLVVASNGLTSEDDEVSISK